ncbi:hypothetical protein GCM10027341_34840 [Spirosoma knui]
MTDAERDELIEKSLLKELDATDEARVQQLRRDDSLFRQEYEFQERLMQQVQLNRRQELLGMFTEFKREQLTETDETNIIPNVPFQPNPEEAGPGPLVIPFRQRPWVRVAASLLLAALLGLIVWQLVKYDPKPIAKDGRDSVKTNVPKDTQRLEPTEIPMPLPQPQGPVANKPIKPKLLQGPTRLPYYEIDDMSFGFGKDQKVKQYQTVVFSRGSEPAYEFQDTLKIYLPTLPTADPAWSLVYSQDTDTYYLIRSKTRYEIVKGLQGKQPLKQAP